MPQQSLGTNSGRRPLRIESFWRWREFCPYATPSLCLQPRRRRRRWAYHSPPRRQRQWAVAPAQPLLSPPLFVSPSPLKHFIIIIRIGIRIADANRPISHDAHRRYGDYCFPLADLLCYCGARLSSRAGAVGARRGEPCCCCSLSFSFSSFVVAASSVCCCRAAVRRIG